MTDHPDDAARLREIQGREQKATNGPWQVHHQWDDTGYPGFFIHGMSGEEKRDIAQLEANDDFISQARADIPWLLDQLTARETDGIEALVAEMRSDAQREDSWSRLREKLERYADRLEAALVSRATRGGRTTDDQARMDTQADFLGAATAPELLEALKALYALTPDCEGDYLLDGNKGEFAIKAIRVPGIGEACRQARAAIKKAEESNPARAQSVDEQPALGSAPDPSPSISTPGGPQAREYLAEKPCLGCGTETYWDDTEPVVCDLCDEMVARIQAARLGVVLDETGEEGR